MSKDNENPCKIKIERGRSSSGNSLAGLSKGEIKRRRDWAYEKYCRGRRVVEKRGRRGLADIIDVAEFNNEDVREYGVPKSNGVSNY